MFPVVSLNHAKTGAGGPPTPDMGIAESPFSAVVGLEPSINDYGLSKRPGPHPCDVDLQRDLEPKRRERR